MLPEFCLVHLTHDIVKSLMCESFGSRRFLAERRKVRTPKGSEPDNIRADSFRRQVQQKIFLPERVKGEMVR
jgi:hypothetical protein